MTISSITLTFDDGERIALERALRLMIDLCNEKTRAGVNVPYAANRSYCKELLKKLENAEAKTVTRNTFNDDFTD